MSGGRGDRRRDALALFAIAVLALVPRLVALDADPPRDFRGSFYSDEGAYAHNARAHARWGRWVPDGDDRALVTAPLWSVVLRGAYGAYGVGLWQTRLPVAVAGVLTCLIVFAFVRREASFAAAVLAGIVLALDYFFVSHNRVAFTESLQALFVAVAVLAALRSRAAPAWGAVSAVSVLAALATKPTSLPALAVIATLYVVLYARTRGDAMARGRVVRAMVTFTIVGALTAAAAGVAFVLPHRDLLAQAYARFAAMGAGSGESWLPTGRLLWFGARSGYEPIRDLSGFFAQQPLLIVAVTWLALARLLRRDHRPLGALEAACWVWLAVSFAATATHPDLAPDRRHLLHVAPLGILVALAATSAPGHGMERRPGLGQGVAAWLVATLVVGVYLRELLAPALFAAGAGIHVGKEPGLSPALVATACWLLALPLAAVVIGRARASTTLVLLGAPALVVACVVPALDGARLAAHLARPQFGMRDASRDLGRLASSLPRERRVAVGNSAETLALENDVFAFAMAEAPQFGIAVNPGGVTRYRPAFLILTTIAGHPMESDIVRPAPGMSMVRRYDYGYGSVTTTVWAMPDSAPDP